MLCIYIARLTVPAAITDTPSPLIPSASKMATQTVFTLATLFSLPLVRPDGAVCPASEQPPDQCAQDQQLCDHVSDIPGCDLGQYCYPLTLANCPVVSMTDVACDSVQLLSDGLIDTYTIEDGNSYIDGSSLVIQYIAFCAWLS